MVRIKKSCKQSFIEPYQARASLVTKQGCTARNGTAHFLKHHLNATHRTDNNYKSHVFVKMAAGYWSKEETLKLISIWNDDTVQAQLEGCRRNSDVYRKIAKELTEMGYTRTLEQCRDKMKKLKAKYKKVKDKRSKTGQVRYPEWNFFDAMDNVLGHKPATQPPAVVDSGNYLDDHDQQSQWSPEIVENPSSNHSVSTSDDGAALSSVSTERSTDSQSNQSDRLSQAEATSKPTSKKRKRSKFEVAGQTYWYSRKKR